MNKYTIAFYGEIEVEAETEDEALMLLKNPADILEAIERVDFIGYRDPVENEDERDEISNPEGFDHARPEPLTQDEINGYRDALRRREKDEAHADELNDRMRDEGH